MFRVACLAVALSMVALSAAAQSPRAAGPGAGAGPPVTGTAEYKIVTASERGTYIVLGRDLAKFVAPDANIELESVPSAGSAENVKRLRFEPGVKLAIVQSDVYQAFLNQADDGNREAAELIKPLRLVLPLYQEEVYFIVRADSPYNFIHEIKDARINVGPVGSGTALTATTAYSLLFGYTAPKITFLSNEEALVKLTSDDGVDVAVVVGGQPMKLLADIKPEGKQLLKFLRFDSRNGRQVLDTYDLGNVKASSYPNLLTADFPTIAVRAYLVTYDFNVQQSGRYLVRFAKSLCQNFRQLQAEGHPKWKEVTLGLPELGKGWKYYEPTAREIRACTAEKPLNRLSSPKSCSQQERILGLCS
jgi:TRAP transporter TAXI family solute receptor